MRDLRVRAAFVGLILALPPLMAGMNPRQRSMRAAVLPVLAVEGVLVAGLVVAVRERSRLACLQATPRAPSLTDLVPAHHARLARKVHTGRV